jgi:hypothetical protein
MHDYLEKVAATVGAVRRKVLSSSDFELLLFLGVVIVVSIAFIALCISWLRDKRKKERQFLLERELYRVQETDDTDNRERKTVIDAFRIRFPLDDPPEKRSTVEDYTDTIDEEAERKYYEGKRA